MLPRGDSPDNYDVECDDENRPPRVVGNPKEVRDDRQSGNNESEAASPTRSGEESQCNNDSDGTQDGVDPSPRGDVESVGVVDSDDEEIVVGCAAILCRTLTSPAASSKIAAVNVVPAAMPCLTGLVD